MKNILSALQLLISTTCFKPLANNTPKKTVIKKNCSVFLPFIYKNKNRKCAAFKKKCGKTTRFGLLLLCTNEIISSMSNTNTHKYANTASVKNKSVSLWLEKHAFNKDNLYPSTGMYACSELHIILFVKNTENNPIIIKSYLGPNNIFLWDSLSTFK